MIYSDIEFDIAKEIINVGLGKAADSVAFFTHDKVIIRGLDFKVEDLENINNVSNKNENETLYVLSTEILGELKGICYLIFSESEVNKLLKVCLPESIRNNQANLKEMGEAILLEMDNIIVASVITQFSNFFKYKMHGDIPRLSITISKGFEQIVRSANRCGNYLLYFKSEFFTLGLNITPEFIWLLDDKYFEGVKNLAQDEKLIAQLKHLNGQF